MTSNIGRRRDAARKDPNNTSYQERRREIVEAAAHVFRAKGFQGASLGDVAAHLNTDRANLYYYVGSKEELLDSAVTDAVEANLARALEIVASGGTPAEQMRTLVTELMQSYADNFPFLYVFIQEDLRHVAPKRAAWAQRMRKANHEYEEIVTGIVQRGLDDGSFKHTGPAWVLAYGIIGLVAWTNRWFDPDRAKAGADVIGQSYADLVLNGLTGE
jgi:AcrR family transcriptional regulator